MKCSSFSTGVFTDIYAEGTSSDVLAFHFDVELVPPGL